MWDERKKAVLAVVERKVRKDIVRAQNESDFYDALDGLEGDLVNEDAYQDAARAGVGAVHDNEPKTNASDVADVWIGHVRPYANKVPTRIAGALAEATNDAVDENGDDVDAVLAAVDSKLEALRSSITRYAEPPWGTGNEAYGDELDANDVLLVWQLDDGVDDHCAVCPDLAARSPYKRGDIPTWPKLGDTPCMDKCYCWITADPDSWAAAFGG